MSYHEALNTGNSGWRSIREEIRLRYERAVIAAAGSPPDQAQVRQAAKDGKPMHHISCAVRLETVLDILAKYRRTSQEQWRRAQELPEYVHRNQHACNV